MLPKRCKGDSNHNNAFKRENKINTFIKSIFGLKGMRWCKIPSTIPLVI
jgi:hypothetical protein